MADMKKFLSLVVTSPDPGIGSKQNLKVNLVWVKTNSYRKKDRQPERWDRQTDREVR